MRSRDNKGDSSKRIQKKQKRNPKIKEVEEGIRWEDIFKRKIYLNKWFKIFSYI